MLSFLARRTPRTITAPLNAIVFDAGLSSIEFKHPTDHYLVINRWPPASNTRNQNIALRPPLHWHRHQSETFHVLQGSAEFICDGAKSIKSAGESVTMPARATHTFCNASSTEELVIEFVLEPRFRERDEAFFREFRSILFSFRLLMKYRECTVLSR
jgi:mannose-6-phosphate isomerase-like protein (cupin superfamily)